MHTMHRSGSVAMWRCAVLAVILAAAAVSAVDRTKFRKCDDTSFCKRHRSKQPPETYRVTPESIKVVGGTLLAELRSSAVGAAPLKLEGRLYESGAFRVRVTETLGEPRWEVPDVLQADTMREGALSVREQTSDRLVLGVGDAQDVVVSFSPLRIALVMKGEERIVMNDRGLLHIEQRQHQRSEAAEAAAAAHARATETASAGRTIIDWGEDGKPIYADSDVAQEAVEEAASAAAASAVQAEGRAGSWEESFGGHTDSKPHGPTAVACDVAFPAARHVYGIPEHATQLSLKPTDGSSGAYSEPYRLYNLDVFEYELDEPMALYGAIPLLLAHSAQAGTAAVFWLNPSETFIDITRAGSGTSSHWISESGVVDAFLLPGPTAFDVFRQYMLLTGAPQLPPLFSLAYHQCRWNYKDEGDVEHVHNKFEEHDFPVDVLWLDIEHTDGKRYFTWDKHAFPDPEEMQRKLAAHGRKMVTIVDPHIKRDPGYIVHSEASRKGLYVKKKDGSEFDGWCWPGASSYLDFTSPAVRDWWAERFSLDNYRGSTLSLFTWNDMNEPSVFNGPEVSMPKDALSLAGVEHREWHNVYGSYFHMATAAGLVARHPEKNARPFVLSRAFFAGSQRHGAIWTGDNAAQWSHLRASVPMLLSIGLAGLPFAGADVGGFFGNPDAELLVRWYQAGAYQPFFRAHAHIETKRREPWLFGEEDMRLMREAVKERYALLPLWYTLMEEAHRTGAPAMRPLWVHFPQDEETFEVDDAFLVGDSLLVHPVASAGQHSTTVLLPGSEPWFDARELTPVGPGRVTVATPLHITPVFQRGGTIIPRQTRLRRSSEMMRRDPYTLTVAPNAAGRAEGGLYLDDGTSFDFTRGMYRRRRFVLEDNVLRSESADSGNKKFAPPNRLERIQLLRVTQPPRRIVARDLSGDRDLDFVLDEAKGVLTVRKPDLPVAYDWEIRFEF